MSNTPPTTNQTATQLCGVTRKVGEIYRRIASGGLSPAAAEHMLQKILDGNSLSAIPAPTQKITDTPWLDNLRKVLPDVWHQVASLQDSISIMGNRQVEIGLSPDEQIDLVIQLDRVKDRCKNIKNSDITDVTVLVLWLGSLRRTMGFYEQWLMPGIGWDKRYRLHPFAHQYPEGVNAFYLAEGVNLTANMGGTVHGARANHTDGQFLASVEALALRPGFAQTSKRGVGDFPYYNHLSGIDEYDQCSVYHCNPNWASPTVRSVTRLS